MSVIYTGSSTKALWPGIKEHWSKEYEEYGLGVPMTKDKQVICINEVVDSKEQGKEYIEILNDIIENLKAKVVVHITVSPNVVMLNGSKNKYRVQARFVVGGMDDKVGTDMLRIKATARYGIGYTDPRGIFGSGGT